MHTSAGYLHFMPSFRRPPWHLPVYLLATIYLTWVGFFLLSFLFSPMGLKIPACLLSPNESYMHRSNQSTIKTPAAAFILDIRGKHYGFHDFVIVFQPNCLFWSAGNVKPLTKHRFCVKIKQLPSKWYWRVYTDEDGWDKKEISMAKNCKLLI